MSQCNSYITMKKTLLGMKSGQTGRVIEISGGYNLQQRLVSMGIYAGREITKLSHFALRGPVAIKTGRTVIALGHAVAGKIMIDIE